MLIHRTLIWVVFLSILFVSGCDPVVLTIGDEIEKPDDVNPVSNVVVYIRNGAMFTTTTKGQNIKQVTSVTDGGVGISLSYDKQRIAYITTAKKIKIIDLNGTLIDAPVSYTNVIDIEWAKDNETLFILSAGTEVIRQYGPGVTLPYISLPPSVDELYAFSVSPNYDVAVSYYEGGFSGNYDVIHVVTAAGDDYVGSNYDEVAFIQFPFGGGPFISGHTKRTQGGEDEYKPFKWYYETGGFYSSIDFYDYDYPNQAIYKDTYTSIYSSNASGSSPINAVNLFFEGDDGVESITSFTTGYYNLAYDWKD